MFVDLLSTKTFNHRYDPRVPAFADTGCVLFMDGHCMLCANAARWIAKRDVAGRILICPVQSLLGQAVLRHYGLSPEDPETWLCLNEGRPLTGMQAVLTVAGKLGGWYRLLQVLWLLPKPVREGLYRVVARNRFRVFGAADICAIDDAELNRRLLH